MSQVSRNIHGRDDCATPTKTMRAAGRATWLSRVGMCDPERRVGRLNDLDGGRE